MNPTSRRARAQARVARIEAQAAPVWLAAWLLAGVASAALLALVH